MARKFTVNPGAFMRPSRPFHAVIALAAVLSACASAPMQNVQPASFDVVEASIADIHAAMRAGRLTSLELVRAYLTRIEAYDKKGPSINAIIEINAKALERAAELDAAFARTGSFTGPHAFRSS
jgi:amidase